MFVYICFTPKKSALDSAANSSAADDRTASRSDSRYCANSRACNDYLSGGARKFVVVIKSAPPITNLSATTTTRLQPSAQRRPVGSPQTERHSLSSDDDEGRDLRRRITQFSLERAELRRQSRGRSSQHLLFSKLLLLFLVIAQTRTLTVSEPGALWRRRIRWHWR